MKHFGRFFLVLVVAAIAAPIESKAEVPMGMFGSGFFGGQQSFPTFAPPVRVSVGVNVTSRMPMPSPCGGVCGGGSHGAIGIPMPVPVPVPYPVPMMMGGWGMGGWGMGGWGMGGWGMGGWGMGGWGRPACGPRFRCGGFGRRRFRSFSLAIGIGGFGGGFNLGLRNVSF